MAGLELIEEIEVTAGGLATIDFDSIPATYKHLAIHYSAQTEGALAAIKFAFNTDTTDSNYQTSRILNAGTTLSGTTFNNRYCGAATGTAEALPGFGEVTFPYYASTLGEHGSLSRGFYRTGSVNYNDHWFCQWNSTAVIDRIRLTVDGGGDFKEGSIFSLYGLPADVPADLKISDLSAITTLDGTEEFVVADTGTSKKITAADLGVTLGYAKLSQVETQGTAGGSASSTTWNTRVINTEDLDADGIVSISANQFTLQAGTYRIFAVGPCHNVAQNKLRLRNITDSTTTILGVNGYNTGQTSQAILTGQFTIAGAKAFEIQHYTAGAQASNGLGPEVNASGVSEVYTVVEIWKVA